MPFEQDTQKTKILVVEDEVLVAAELESHLKNLGYTVCGKASSGKKAIELADQKHPDLVLMDIILKGDIDGIEAADIIRSRYEIPVIFVTAYADEERLKRAKLTLPFGYVLKPFQEKNLKVSIEMALYVAKVNAKRKKAEQALKESEEKYRQLFHLESDALFLIDNKDGQIIEVNNAASKIYEYDRNELLNKKNTDLSAEPFNTRQATINGSKIIPLRYHKKKSGLIFPVEITATHFTWKGRNVHLAAIRDISGRISQEQALKENEERFRKLFELAPVGIAQVTSYGKFLKVNKKLTEILGYSEFELQSMSFEDIIHPDDLESFNNIIRQTLKGEIETFQLEQRYFHKDGSSIYIILFLSVMRDEKRKVQYAIAVIEDITERKRAEAERKRLEAQLLHSRKMEAIGTLAGGIAHDFNNLLQVINGYAEILLIGKTKNNQGYHELTQIQKATERAANLIKQLLAFSRKSQSEHRPVNLNREIEYSKAILERTIPKMIQIELNLDKNLKTINADPAQIEQIILNLGSNAADSMPDGGKLIIQTSNISLTEKYCQNHLEATPGEYVILTITDTGYGMDQETLQHIFEPFFTTKEIGKGTGLGLASVYGIVKSHGGYITCHSEFGQGTTFKIYFPFIEQVDFQRDKELNEEIPTGRNETILVVDDEDSIRDLVYKALQSFGYNVLTAASGEEAIEIFQNLRAKIDLIILDLGMPGMGGNRCMYEILKINPSTKILIASGYSINNEVKKTLNSGAAGFIGKPYHLKHILHQVRIILNTPD